MATASTTTTTSSRPIWRWATFTVLVLLIAALFVYVQTTEAVDDAFRMVPMMLSVYLTIFVFALWFLIFGGSRWWVRLGLVIGGFAFLIGFMLIGFIYLWEIRGVTGDSVPRLAWKWTPKADYSLPSEPPVETPTMAPALTTDVPDYPRFLGPNGDAHLTGANLDPDWKNHPPREVWRKAVGPGSSSFAVVKERAVTQEQRGDFELVTCYNLRDGALLWSHKDQARFSQAQAGDGPQATPTIVGDKVFTMGGTGILNCLDFNTGKPLWPAVNVVDQDNAALPVWGKSCSPLVFDQETANGVKQLVVVTLGEIKKGADPIKDAVYTVAAYDGNTGKLVWGAGAHQQGGGVDRQGYATPVLATIAGTKQVLSVNATTVTAHDPALGNILWTYDWSEQMAKCSQPVVLPDDKLFLSMGYHVGGQLLQVKKSDGKWDVTQIWAPNLNMRTTFSNVVIHKGYVYGLDDGVLECIDLNYGAKKWRDGRYRFGQVLGVDDLLIVQAENGTVYLVAASPDRHQELGEIDAMHARTWNNPVLVGKYLLVRNGEEAVCYELPLKDGK